MENVLRVRFYTKAIFCNIFVAKVLKQYQPQVKQFLFQIYEVIKGETLARQ